MYYVYEWFIVETGEVIYVGKGTGKRFKVRKHNKFFNEMINRYKCDSRIIKHFQDEKDAFSYEYYRVNELKRIGQCVCNIYAGGFGGTTSWWTDIRRKEYSDKNCMKSEIQRKRMSENNPMKNPEIAKCVGSQHARPVIIDGEEYESVRSAMDKYGVASATIKSWCEKGITKDRKPCRYKDEEQKVYTGRYNKGSCRPILYDNKRYESAVDVAKELNVSPSVVSLWAKNGFSTNGISCHFEDDKSIHIYNKKDYGWQNRKPVIVNGIKYESIRIAEKELGLKQGYLTPYFRGIRKNKKYICKYDNQHPSQGNFDNSTLEGSETNG